MSHISQTSHQSHSARRRLPSTNQYQPLLIPSPSSTSSPLPPLHSQDVTSEPQRRRRSSRRNGGGGHESGWASTATGGAASESGMSSFSVLSNFPLHPYDAETLEAKRRRKEKRRAEKEEYKKLQQQRLLRNDNDNQVKDLVKVDPTDSPLRRWVKWILSIGGSSEKKTIFIWLSIVIFVKWSIGLGGYSGYKVPPLRGDFEAQRHWISLTSSIISLDSIKLPFLPIEIPLYRPTSTSPSISNVVVPISEWYSHDLEYWGLDYPPLTAYHSFLLGLIARLSPTTAQYVTLRPHSVNSTQAESIEWERVMSEMESSDRGGMRNWMRATVVIGDLFMWVSAVLWYCWHNFGSDRPSSSSGRSSSKKVNEKALRTTLVAALTILFQPALILIDNGHFQYNSIMLALTLWSINAFQSGHDLIGSALFVASLGFKQMALYYAPGVFAYLLGKCLWLGGREGSNLFLHLGLTVVLSFTMLFLPFLSPFPTALFQSLHRIFPFARGLFEDKVANFWCALNVVIKLRNLASVTTLARMSLLLTGTAVLPSTIGVIWISYRLGRQTRRSSPPSTTTTTTTSTSSKEASSPAPTCHLLPHLLLTSSLCFFLFSFQVHEKSILLPLMPLTLLMGGREKGYGRLDWEWGVLLNNVAVFSMFPLLKKDGLIIQYIVLTLFWNYLIGYNPLSLRSGSFVKLLSLTAYSTIFTLHILELITTPPSHLPDLWPVLNAVMSCGVFGIGWLWGGKRLAQESWAIGGF